MAGEKCKRAQVTFSTFPHHFNCPMMMNSEYFGRTEKIGNENKYRKQMVVGERWKWLVGELFFGGGIIFGGGKVEKYL